MNQNCIICWFLTIFDGKSCEKTSVEEKNWLFRHLLGFFHGKHPVRDLYWALNPANMLQDYRINSKDHSETVDSTVGFLYAWVVRNTWSLRDFRVFFVKFLKKRTFMTLNEVWVQSKWNNLLFLDHFWWESMRRSEKSIFRHFWKKTRKIIWRQ